MSVQEPSSIRLAGTLSVAGLVSGLVLVGVYLGTQPLIEKNKEAALRAAILKILPETEEFDKLVAKDGKLVPDDEVAGKPAETDIVYRARNASGDVVGYAIPWSGTGWDSIKLIFGFDHRRQVIVGMEVLESRETPGLGDKILADPHFHANFEALEVTSEGGIEAVAKGEKDAPNEVDCITGATISSKGVVSILNAGIDRWYEVLVADAAPEGEGG